MEEEVARSPFVGIDAYAMRPLRIADGAGVRVSYLDDSVAGVVIEYQSSGNYLVRLANGQMLAYDGAELESDNPGAERVLS